MAAAEGWKAWGWGWGWCRSPAASQRMQAAGSWQVSLQEELELLGFVAAQSWLLPKGILELGASGVTVIPFAASPSPPTSWV